ncbi:MAG: hypothetical protein FWE22_06575 [Firmicutes bacterium]|nr:hypothetical protein [Bacillota bacterium]
MSRKRIYRVENIYYINTRGFSFFIEKQFQFLMNFVNKNFRLFNNGKYFDVQLRGIESLSGMKGHFYAFLLNPLNGNNNELMEFLGMSNKKNSLNNVENIYLEVECFDELEI